MIEERLLKLIVEIRDVIHKFIMDDSMILIQIISISILFHIWIYYTFIYVVPQLQWFLTLLVSASNLASLGAVWLP